MNLEADMKALDRIRARLTETAQADRAAVNQVRDFEYDTGREYPKSRGATENWATGECTTAPAPAMLGFEDSIWQAVERTAQILYTLNALCSRIYGSDPSVGSEGSDPAREPACMVERLHAGLSHLHDNLLAIEYAQARLAQLT